MSILDFFTILLRSCLGIFKLSVYIYIVSYVNIRYMCGIHNILICAFVQIGIIIPPRFFSRVYLPIPYSVYWFNFLPAVYYIYAQAAILFAYNINPLVYLCVKIIFFYYIARDGVCVVYDFSEFHRFTIFYFSFSLHLCIHIHTAAEYLYNLYLYTSCIVENRKNEIPWLCIV